MGDFFESLASKVNRPFGLSQPRLGTVTSSDPRTATARILLQPEGVLTGWLPVLTQWAGAGWGISCPPSAGDQVLVIPQEGDVQQGLILGRLFSDTARPPEIEPGEMILRHRSGSAIRLLNTGEVAIDGDLRVSGEIYDAHGSLGRLRTNYDAHIHYTSGGQATSSPLPMD